jgi:hypothetical protein
VLFRSIAPPERSAPDPVRLALAGAERLLLAGPDDPLPLAPEYLREPDAKLPTPAL